ncbi:MAG: YfhO family protein, partial [Acutalibacteraceae bacterium]|nr:YfhO family protein [Acutalibacteraceae bacterium]
NSNPFEVQSQLFGSATGIHTVYNDIEVTDISGTGASCNDLSFSDSGCYPYTVEDTAGASLTFRLEVKQSGNAYVYFKTSNNNIDNITFTLDDGTVIAQTVDTKPYIMDLGYLKKGETIKLYAPIAEGTEGYSYLYAVTLDDKSFDKGYNQLKADSLNVTKFEETEIEGTINASKDGILYTSINYDSGWNVYIDGQKVSNEQLVGIGDDALLGVYIAKGEHTVSFKYIPQGLLLGCSISALTVVIFLLLISIMKSGLFNFNPPLYVEEPQELEPVLENESDDENKETLKEAIDKLFIDVSVTQDLTEESDAE